MGMGRERNDALPEAGERPKQTAPQSLPAALGSKRMLSTLHGDSPQLQDVGLKVVQK